ncbi:MAG: hypothetical protein DID91_2727703892 [Candidatus Nitrotoga sp. MKT]|nr:MAG: hypothetical protein DID91_2727703892 [Candidatus Nitrotoga sp. MKT]
MGDIQGNLIRVYAKRAAEEVTRKSIRAMQRITDTLAGEDSGLANAWDEFCVQAQGEDSCFRDTYDVTLYQIVNQYVEALQTCDLRALWLQTDSGWDWHWEIQHPAETELENGSKQDMLQIPYDSDDVVNDIINTYVLPRAESYSNRKITKFIENQERARY